MKNVKFLSTSAGSYGVAHTGDELVLKNSVAAELEKNGTVEVLGDADEDAEESAVKGSLRIHDETGVKEKAETETDPDNPTGKKEKNAKAGPNGPKKK
jgi:hypothetical protein